MTGLDKIISEIMCEAENEVKEILDTAYAEAKQISESAKCKSEATVQEINAMSIQQNNELTAGFETAVDIQNRRMILAKKQSFISETLQIAKETLYGLSDVEYFDLLIKLATKAAQVGDGKIFMNEQDRKRIPPDFETRLNSALPQGSSLKLSNDIFKIDGGVVLQYGDIVENCSIEAIFAARSDEFSDIVRNVLFEKLN